MPGRALFLVAAIALTIDAAVSARRQRTSAPSPLATQALLVVTVLAWLAAGWYHVDPQSSAVLSLVVLACCLYSVIASLVARPRDPAQAGPRAVAAAAIVASFVIAFFPPIDGWYLTPQPGGAPLILSSAGTPLRITRVHHASVLIEAGSEHILTDPWFSTRRHYDAGEAVGLAADKLPPLTLITSGQDHYDHSDFDALAPHVRKEIPVIVPDGTKQAASLRALGFKDVSALKPWDSREVGAIRVTAVPARAGVSPRDFDYEFAYVYSLHGRHVFFASHRVSPEVAAQVKQKFPRIDVALLAINDLRVRPKLMKQLSMSPDDAAGVARALEATVAIPLHYRYHGSWVQEALLLSHKGEPMAFTDALRRIAPGTTLVALPPGQPLVLRATDGQP
jgi:L-ascorbate metabolism protein UlaG (beta-lactamase superfamily)